MATLSPTIDFRDPTQTGVALGAVTLTGNGALQSIPTGTVSNVVTVRIYNNYANIAGIADATNCVLAAYDTATIQGSAATVPVLNAWLQVRVLDYNGATTNQDIQFASVGGPLKHVVPVNGAVLSGSGPNYFTVQIQVAVPASATGSVLSQALWLEADFNL